MTIAYVSLGSNMGQSLEFLSKAKELIAAEQGLKITAISPVYNTEPQGIKEQNWFYNQVIRMECAQNWSAYTLLNCLHNIEEKLGRVRSKNKEMQFGPRCIDLDLLLFGHEQHHEPQCMVPHPRMHQRAFVLIALRDVARQDILPFELEHCLSQINYSVQGQKIFQK